MKNMSSLGGSLASKSKRGRFFPLIALKCKKLKDSPVTILTEAVLFPSLIFAYLIVPLSDPVLPLVLPSPPHSLELQKEIKGLIGTHGLCC